jgi:hypothetical protein
MKTYSNTQGPWKIGSNGASVKVVDAEDKAICMLTPRKEAWNGDLIAAAPELLDALRWALDQIDDDLDLDHQAAMNAARAAIAKATGGAQ